MNQNAKVVSATTVMGSVVTQKRALPLTLNYTRHPVGALLGVVIPVLLLGCKESKDRERTPPSTLSGTHGKVVAIDEARTGRRIDLALLRSLSDKFHELEGDQELFAAFRGDLVALVEQRGEYEEVARLIQQLPSRLSLQILHDLMATSSRLPAEQELAGRLLLATSLGGPPNPSNNLINGFFKDSSRLLPELRRNGISSKQAEVILPLIYRDLARKHMGETLTILEADSQSWDTTRATSSVIDYLLSIDPVNTGQSILELEPTNTRDTAIKALLEWMRRHKNASEMAPWFDLIKDPLLKSELEKEYSN